MKKFLETKHKDWLQDVANDYEKYGKCKDDEVSAETLKYKNEVTKCWMNTRHAFLKHYKKVREIIDADYSEEFLCFVDEKRMLNENFQPKWNVD